MTEEIRGVSEEEALRYKEWLNRVYGPFGVPRSNRVYRLAPDPVGYSWLTYAITAVMLCTLSLEVLSLYCGHWMWAVQDALLVLINAQMAYFNTLPLSRRARFFSKRFRPAA